MSGTGPQLAPETAKGAMTKGRSPLAHLLHALNQPLTGLQCSLELAAAGPRPTEHYVRTLREGLDLVGRMRILVEAIRELSETSSPDSEKQESFLLDTLLRDTAVDLLPVAESKCVRLVLMNPTSLPVRADRLTMATLMFRLLESALSLAQRGTELRIAGAAESDHASLMVSWKPSPPLEHSPFSRPDLGLLIAQAGWERAGATWTDTRTETTQACIIRMPLAFPLAAR